MNHESLQDWSMKAAQWIHCTLHQRTRSFVEFHQRHGEAMKLLEQFDDLVADVDRICLDDYPLPTNDN